MLASATCSDVVPGDHTEDVEIVDRGRRRACRRCHTGTQVGSRVVEHRTADRSDPEFRSGLPARGRVDVDDIERTFRRRGRELVAIDLLVVGVAVLEVRIIGPRLVEIAPHAKHAAPFGVRQVADTRTALDVTTKQVEVALVVGRCRVQSKKSPADAAGFGL